MDANSETVNQQIVDCLTLLKHVLGPDLLGVYLYGSILMGGLQKYSDIDIFAVTNRETTRKEKELLEKAILNISGIYAVNKDRKPIELTIVVQSDINPWQYPPKFDFLYGDWMRKNFEAGNIEPWSSKFLPNLALVITQLRLSHTVLFGPNPQELLPQVPYNDFIHATTAEIDNLMKDLDTDTRNVLLTLARIWSTLETDTIRSKVAAADWTIEKLPVLLKPVMEKAKNILLGQEDEDWNKLEDDVKTCAEYMIGQIHLKTAVLKSSQYSEKYISIA